MDDLKGKKQFDEIAAEYDEGLELLLGKYGGKDTAKYAEYKIALIHSVLKKKPRRILDFGCGTGRSLIYLKKYFPDSEVYGCDVSKESLEIASNFIPRERLFVNNNKNDIIEFGIKYDLVFLSCVLHHIAPNERKYWVDAISDILNTEGTICVFEHNIINPVTKRIVMDKDNKVDDINWMLSHKNLLNLFNKKSVVWHGYTLFSPIRFYGVITLEKCLKWLYIGAQHCVIVKNN